MNQIDAEIDDYLTRYAATLSAFDSTAAAQLWATPPGMIIDDRFAGVVDDRETMAHSLEQSYPLYRELGLASVSHECLNVERLTAAISLVKVRWIFYGANGDQLTDSNATTSCAATTMACTPASASNSTTPRSSEHWPPNTTSTSPSTPASSRNQRPPATGEGRVRRRSQLPSSSVRQDPALSDPARRFDALKTTP